MRQVMRQQIDQHRDARSSRQCAQQQHAELASAAAQPQPITRVPGWTHDPRLQCAPDEMPFGAGFAAAGVGVDITTGRSWK